MSDSCCALALSSRIVVAAWHAREVTEHIINAQKAGGTAGGIAKSLYSSISIRRLRRRIMASAKGGREKAAASSYVGEEAA